MYVFQQASKQRARYLPYLLALIAMLYVLSGCGDRSSNATDTGVSSGPVAGGTTANSVTEEPLEATDDPARTEAEEARGSSTGKEATATSLDAQEELAPQGTVVTVERVIEGDTLEISPAVGGKNVVRLIGIDAPETRGQPFGAPAVALANSIIGGRKVALGFDTEKTKQSGQLLAYVRLPGGDLFNEYMVRAGYAQVDISPPNVKYKEELLAAQRQARARNTGIWSLPPGQLCKLADHGNGIGGGCEDSSNTPDSGSSGDAPQDASPIAGVPPVPPDGDYDCGHFNNQQQAQKVLDSDPSDPHDLDGEDQNGIACDSLGG